MQESIVQLSPRPASGADQGEAQTACGQQAASSLPAHLIGLSDSDWALWRTAGLRSAGFPIDQTLALSMPACGEAAEHVLACERELERLRSVALDDLGARIARTDPADRLHRQLVKTRRAIRDSSPPWPAKTAAIHVPASEAFYAAYQALLDAEQAFRQHYAQASLQTSRRLLETARQERFREAIVWQNRHAFRTAVAPLSAWSEQEARGRRQRQYETLVANYLQRYCTKNDSIGFFGPIGWATLSEQEEALTLQPGEALLASREVFLEFWGMEILAEIFSADPAMRPWIAPRLMPHLFIEENTLLIPFARPVPLTRQQAAVLRACDGNRLAHEISRALLLEHPQLFASEAEVYALLERLEGQNRLFWRLALPPEGSYPERDLRQLLERVGDEQLRAEKLAVLVRMEQARAAIQAATGDAQALDGALEQLESIFRELTGRDTTRNDGQTYGSRTLVYEDCRRDVGVTLGADFLRTLEAPLVLMLQSARWLTYQMGCWHEELFARAYEELAQLGQTASVDFSRFWLWMLNQLFDDEEHFSDRLIEEFQQRWAAVLGTIPEDVSRVSYTSAELRARVQEQFQAPRPGWNAGRYHSPDVLVCAASPQAMRQGDYQIIMGELHVAMNTLQLSLFLSQYPERDVFLRNSQADQPETRLLPVLSKHVFPFSGRVRPCLINPNDARLIYTTDTGVPAHPRLFSAGELVVERLEGQLLVRSRDHSWQCPLVEALGKMLERHVFHCFKMFPRRLHTPRITVDEKVIIAREAWGFPVAQLSYLHEKDPARQFLAIRRWARANHLPQRSFFRVSHEQKPCFLDLDSLTSVANFAKMARINQEQEGQEAFVTLSEMLPDVDQLWLTDKDAHHYTSELRIVALDLVKAFAES
ncbi:MAG TPA: lantibiotic dehydratase [Ktedonobacteraceae bacterium]|nr:lantibiotic dehydratase [Ktedonobacteraceae bacterium]